MALRFQDADDFFQMAVVLFQHLHQTTIAGQVKSFVRHLEARIFREDQRLTVQAPACLDGRFRPRSLRCR